MAMNSPQEILTYANLSNAAYSKGAIPMGWTLLKTAPPSDNGFAAMAVRNEATGEIVIAYRGTQRIKGVRIKGVSFEITFPNRTLVRPRAIT